MLYLVVLFPRIRLISNLLQCLIACSYTSAIPITPYTDIQYLTGWTPTTRSSEVVLPRHSPRDVSPNILSEWCKCSELKVPKYDKCGTL